MYFYHPDHLGSSSYITDREGRITQHTEYIAFGEVLFEEHSTSKIMPYLFNGKELDTETGLYYYGARYYDPRVSPWLNVDPLAEKTHDPYGYVWNNPMKFIDPTGMIGQDWYQNKKTGDIEWKDTNKELKGYNHLGRKNTIGISHRSYTGKYTDRMYYLNANGSVTEKTGDGKTTLAHVEGGKSIQTIGGTTITSSKTSVSGLSVQISYTKKLLGPFGITGSIGYVADSYSGTFGGKFYYSYGWAVSNGEGASVDFNTIKPTNPNQLFKVSDFEGFGNSFNLGTSSGFSWGGSSSSQNFFYFNILNKKEWGIYPEGYSTLGVSYNIPIIKPSLGVSISRTNTKFIDNE